MTVIMNDNFINNEIDNVLKNSEINGEIIVNDIQEVNEVNTDNDEYDFYTIQIMNYYNYNKVMNDMNDTISILMKHPYLLYLYVLFIDFMNNVLDNLILFKLFVEKNLHEIIKIYIKTNNIENIYLISNTKFLLINNINKLNKEIFEEIFENNKCELNDESCILIKYKYEGKNYRLYINYKDIQNNIYEFPLNIEKQQEELDKKYNRNILLFFKNECNEIKEATINDIDIKDIIEECNGPFYDFGLIHNHKIYIYCLIKELGLRLDEFNDLKIKYTNFYMDEDEMVLVDHIINISDTNDYIQSEIINKKLN